MPHHRIENIQVREKTALTPKRAREVLVAMPDTLISESELENSLDMIDLKVGKVDEDDGLFKARMDGHFTADQLEAIATWMRDPQGVARAAD